VSVLFCGGVCLGVWFDAGAAVMCRGTYRGIQGNHHPVCNGTCLVANTGWENLTPISVCLIVVPSFCWYWFLAKAVDEHISPAMFYIFGINVIVALALLFVTMFTEPGILPTITYEEYSEENPDIPLRITSRIRLDGREYELSQFRAKFSRYTANCIENFDHYCPWVGNAIGKRNYRYFVLFMFSSLTLSMLLAGTCSALLILYSLREHKSFVNAMEDDVAAAVLAIYGYCMFFSLFGLCLFHARAIGANMTTNEILKGVYNSRNVNPYDKGCYRNWWTFCCSSVPSSRISGAEGESPLLHEQDALAIDIEPMALDRQAVVSDDTDSGSLLQNGHTA